jgi:putative transposase
MRDKKKKVVTFRVCVAYRTHKNRKDGRRVQQKLLFAGWRVGGAPQEIRQGYRKRFGIESSYRQMRQARIFTCTPDPHLRLTFVAVALLLRNLWVWVHQTMLSEGGGEAMTVRLERLRFKRMLEWIDRWILSELHDGSLPCVE